MDTLSDMITAVQTDLTVDGLSTMYTPAVVTLGINRAYRKCAAFFRWPQTEDSVTTSTLANQEYYDYPQNWRPSSVWKLKVGGVDFGTPLLFKDYLYEKENSIPSGRQQLWSNQWMRYFMYPTPTTNGNNDITVWGIKFVDKLVNPLDTTIFSYNMSECNEAVCLEALAILKNKGDLVQPVMRSYIGGTLLLSIEAQNILRNSWGKIQEEQQKYQKTLPMFDVPDMFGKRNTVKDIIGDFK
jgi:hypothetical protein